MFFLLIDCRHNYCWSLKSQYLRLAGIVTGYLLIGILTCRAQQVVVLDWSKRPTTQGDSTNLDVTQSGSGTQKVSFQITNVNNVLYQYTMQCQLRSDTSTPVDFSQLIGIAISGKVEGSSDDKNAQAVMSGIEDYLSQNSCAKTDSCSSVPLNQTLDKLNTLLGKAGVEATDTLNGLLARDKAASGGTLSDDVRTKLLAAVARLQTLIGSTHSVIFTESIDSTKSYACTIGEYLNQAQNGQLLATTDGTMAISVGKPTSHVTLSIGPLFSAIQNRTYSSATAPNGPSGTKTVLAVAGKSPSTSIAALANFAIPTPRNWKPTNWINGDKFGLALAAGPVVRINSSSGTSPAGFFAGVSVDLWHLLFITPGLHIGQFADFPPGFSAPGQVIPPNFQTPQPVIRTTAKFGISISFQVKDFGALKQNGTATAANPGNAKPATPASSGSGAPLKTPAVPASGLVISPNPIDFGSAIGSLTVTVKNATSTVAKLSWNISQTPTNVDFSDGANKCQTIDAGKTCDFTIKLTRPAPVVATTLNIGIIGGKTEDVEVKWQ